MFELARFRFPNLPEQEPGTLLIRPSRLVFVFADFALVVGGGRVKSSIMISQESSQYRESSYKAGVVGSSIYCAVHPLNKQSLNKNMALSGTGFQLEIYI